MSSNSRRVRSTERSSTKAWNWSARISSSPAAIGPSPGASAAAAAAHDGLDARDELLGMARLRQPVVGAHPQAADALGDGRLAGAHDDAEARQRGAELSRYVPGVRAEDREVDDHAR